MKKSTAPACALKVQSFTRSEIVHFVFTSKHLTPCQSIRLLKVGGAA
ncbi:hypothetical protein SGGMMB4_01589 [Sodalis glossinidius str. 'morsitans']|uniref:Uncharacterized protein n=1 Tax=Sodalis glossinidius (strain morsitans) TaxID=343509 RepID=A0A193QH31_SODGM|nr:hypothetical protein SGGMMB4_01589 [Sodalis glossinidius str. 'morsitans']